MKSKTWTRIIALTVLATLAFPLSMTAQSHEQVNSQHHHYQLVQIPTLGWPRHELLRHYEQHRRAERSRNRERRFRRYPDT